MQIVIVNSKNNYNWLQLKTLNSHYSTRERKKNNPFKTEPLEFPGGEAVENCENLCFHCRGTGSIPGEGTKITCCMLRSHVAVWLGQNNKLIA